MTSVTNGFVDEYEVEPKKPTKRGFAKIDVVDVILSGDSNDGPHRPSPTAFEQLTETTISKVYSFISFLNCKSF